MSNATLPPPRTSPSRTTGSALAPDPHLHFRLFGVALAIAVIFDFGSVHRWDYTAYDVLLVFAAFAALCRGGTLAPTLCMATLQVINVLMRSPWTSNHWLFLGFVNAGLVGTWAMLALRERRLSTDLATLYAWFAPVGRWSLLALYFYVVLHKLNGDFFDPATSSAAKFWVAQAEILPFLPTNQAGVLFGIYSTIIAEALIPLLLIFKRTRALGLVTAIVFHAFLAVSPLGRFWDFSSMLYALYVLFLPEDTFTYWREAWSRFSRGPTLERLRSVSAFAWLTVAVFAVFTYLAFQASPLGTTANKKPFLYLWVVYALAYAAFVLPPLLRSRGALPSGILKLATPALAFAPLLVLLNGFCPYLGLKTEAAFAMFSNLQTENGKTNHFFIPASLQIFPYQKQVVEVLETTNEQLKKVIESKRLITLHELRRTAQDYPYGSARVRYAGKEYTFTRFKPDNGLLTPPSELARRTLRFREFFIDGRSGDWH